MELGFIWVIANTRSDLWHLLITLTFGATIQMLRSIYLRYNLPACEVWSHCRAIDNREYLMINGDKILHKTYVVSIRFRWGITAYGTVQMRCQNIWFQWEIKKYLSLIIKYMYSLLSTILHSLQYILRNFSKTRFFDTYLSNICIMAYIFFLWCLVCNIWINTRHKLLSRRWSFSFPFSYIESLSVQCSKFSAIFKYRTVHSDKDKRMLMLLCCFTSTVNI